MIKSYKFKNDITDPTKITSNSWLSYSGMRVGLYPDLFELDLPANKFKKGDLINFRFRKKTMIGKIIKIGKAGVDVNCSGKYYYCYDYDGTSIFRKSNETKNYSTSVKIK